MATMSQESFDFDAINSQDLLQLEPELPPVLNSIPFSNVSPLVYLPHLHKEPELHDIDMDHIDFQVDCPQEEHGKSNWYFNAEENRVYLKMGQTFSIKTSYNANNQDMHLRIMAVFTSQQDRYNSVTRCLNHRASGKDAHPHMKPHIVLCRRPDVSYIGNEEKQTFAERLSLLIPLGCHYSGQITENIGLEFYCQNSCASGINRRPTAIILTLENNQMEILGRKIMHFRVCSGPKRDFELSLKKGETGKKRGADDGHQNPSSSKKPMIAKRASYLDTIVKTEEVTSTDESDTPSEEVTYQLQLPNKETMLYVLEAAFNKICGDLAMNTTKPMKKKYYKKLKQDIYKLKSSDLQTLP